MQTQHLARAVAALMWADEKDTPEEWASAESLFVDTGCDWEEAKPLIEQELDDLIDESDNDEEEETDEELHFGVIDLGDGADPYKTLRGLAAIACSDKLLTWKEVDILHCLGDAMNVSREMVTAALVAVSQSSDVTVEFKED